jgi:hypothetical protein
VDQNSQEEDTNCVKIKQRLFGKIEMHLKLCYNEATDLQYEILAKQMPSMNQRIRSYKSTNELYQCYRKSILYQEELAEQGLPHPRPSY